jgi:hypothetical protein
MTARNSRKTDDNKKATEDAKLGTDGQLQAIHTLVNSSLSAAQAQATALQKENQAQKEIITRLTPPPESVITITQKMKELEAEMTRLKALIPPKENV